MEAIKNFFINNFNVVKNFFVTYQNPILGIIIIAVILTCAIIFRKKIIKLMVDAETGALTAEGMYTLVDKLQQSDWDERMTLVVAKLITSVPLVKLLPTKWVANFLHKIVQKIFDSVKDLLQARKEKLMADAKITKLNEEKSEKVQGIVNDVFNQINVLLLARYGIKYTSLDDTTKETIANVVRDVVADSVPESVSANFTIDLNDEPKATVNIANALEKTVDLNDLFIK